MARLAVTIDQHIFEQLKKGQGETNQRLDALLAELRRLNTNLERQAADRV